MVIVEMFFLFLFRWHTCRVTSGRADPAWQFFLGFLVLGAQIYLCTLHIISSSWFVLLLDFGHFVSGVRCEQIFALCTQKNNMALSKLALVSFVLFWL